MFKYLDLSYWEIVPGLINEFKNFYRFRFWFKYSFVLLFLIVCIISSIPALVLCTIIDIFKCVFVWCLDKLNVVIDFNQEIHIPNFIKSFFKKLIFKGSSNV